MKKLIKSEGYDVNEAESLLMFSKAEMKKTTATDPLPRLK